MVRHHDYFGSMNLFFIGLFILKCFGKQKKSPLSTVLITIFLHKKKSTHGCLLGTLHVQYSSTKVTSPNSLTCLRRTLEYVVPLPPTERLPISSTPTATTAVDTPRTTPVAEDTCLELLDASFLPSVETPPGRFTTELPPQPDPNRLPNCKLLV